MEFPHLQKIQETYPKDVSVLAINTIDDAGFIREYFKREKLTMIPLLPTKDDKDPRELYRNIACPTTYVIGRDGKVVAAFVGFPIEEKDFTTTPEGKVLVVKGGPLTEEAKAHYEAVEKAVATTGK